MLLVLLFSPSWFLLSIVITRSVFVTNKLGVLSFAVLYIWYILNLYNVSPRIKQYIAQQIFLSSLVGSKAV